MGIGTGKQRETDVRRLLLLGAAVLLLLVSACSVEHTTSDNISLSVDKVETGIIAVQSVSNIPKPERAIRQEEISVRPLFDTESPRCLSFKAKAEHDAALLSAPTLAASIDKDGDGQVSLSYDLMNLRAMTLTRRAAQARCDVTHWLDEAKALQKLSARSLARSGTMARVRFVDKRLGRIEQIRREINAAVATGDLKKNSGTRVIKTLTSLLERTNGLRARANSQPAINVAVVAGLPEIELALSEAITHQMTLRTQSDLARNVRFTLSGGYRLENEEIGQIDDDDDDDESFGRASLSIRLGAFNPAWRNGKRGELNAELDKLYEPGVGAIWRILDVHQKNETAISALNDTRSTLMEKLRLARVHRQSIPKEKNADLILSELDILKLRSEIAEVNANLQVLAQAQKKLAP